MANKSKEALDALRVARINLLMKQPFFGQLALKLQFVEIDKAMAEIMKTAAVDGKHFWYNPDFVLSLSRPERIFLVAHEVLHCVFNHLARRVDREPRLYNLAADYVINATLVESGVGTMPEIGAYEEKYARWTSEDVYEDLRKDPNKCKGKGTIDIHPGDPGFPGQDSSGLSEEERRELEESWKDATIQAAAAAAGNVPEGIKRLIRNLTEPKMDWKQMLQMHLQSCVRTDYTWIQPNKRTFGMGITMPSMTMDDMIKICIAIDTSGSISQEMLKDFLSEVKGIMGAFSGYEIHIACFDTEVYSYQCFTQEDDLMSYEPQGGGGTDFMVWWRWAQEQEWIGDVKKCLFFTDGYPFGDWGVDGIVDTLWIVHGSKNEGPFGTTVFYEDY